MKKKWPTLLLLFFLTGSFKEVYAQSTLDLGVNGTQAVATAIKKFASDGYHLKGYRIVITSSATQFDVAFVPPLKASSNPIEAAQPSGWPEVHYFLDSSGEKVLRRLDGQ